MRQTVFVSKGVPQRAAELLKKQGYRVVRGTSAAREGRGAAAVLCLLTDKVYAKTMDAIGPQLKIISNMAAGTDNIDVAAAEKRGVSVANTPDVLTETVAEHAVGLLLVLSRRIVEGDWFVRKGKYKGWKPDLLLGQELRGKTLGIVGYGRIGCRTAEILQKGFGMKVVYHDIKGSGVHEACGAKKISLQEPLEQSDAVSLHVPMLSSTRHLISKKELKAMKKTAYLVNTSRGPVVDEKALVASLERNEIAGAALDVFENEPRLAPGLAKLDNIVLTPHIASASKEARDAMAKLAAKNIIEVLENL